MSRPLDLGAVRALLVVKLSSLGDVVHATPVLRALRAGLPRARIALAVDRDYAALVARNPAIDDIVAAVPGEGRIGRWREPRLALAGRRFDFALDLQGSLRSARWMAAARAGIKAGRAAPGTGRAWRLGWNLVVRPDPARHAIEVCAMIAEAIGVAVPDLAPEIRLDPAADAALAERLAREGLPERGFLLLNPFAAWPSKAWPAERWAALAGRLAPALPTPMVISGGPAEREAGAALARLAGHGVRSLAGSLPLEQSLCLFARAAAMVTGDSGPMHAAAALGTPVVALFGPTWPDCTGPWGDGHRVIQALRPPAHGTFRQDPDGRHIRAIEVAAVERAVLDLWAGLASARPP